MGSGRKIQRTSTYTGTSEDEFEPGSGGRVLRNSSFQRVKWKNNPIVNLPYSIKGRL